MWSSPSRWRVTLWGEVPLQEVREYLKCLDPGELEGGDFKVVINEDQIKRAEATVKGAGS